MACKPNHRLCHVNRDRLQQALELWQSQTGNRCIDWRPVSVGLTNTSYHITAIRDQFVLRLDAENSVVLGIDRVLEGSIQRFANEAGICPAVSWRSDSLGAQVAEWLDGWSLTSDDMKLEENIADLALVMKKCHELPKISGKLDLAERIGFYIDFLKEKDDFEYFRNLQTRAMKIGERLFDENDFCLCHNDLMAENIIRTSDGRLLLIDWEYAAMSPRQFELGLLCELYGWSDTELGVFFEHYGDQDWLGLRDTERRNHWQWLYVLIEYLWFEVQCLRGGLCIPEQRRANYRKRLDKTL